MSDVLNTLVEVKLTNDDSFRIIRETLTRIGITAHNQKKLYQTCHILHKQGRYYIVHFKQMFALDGKDAEIERSDLARLHAIVELLRDWNLLIVLNPEKLLDPPAKRNLIKVVKSAEKNEWEMIAQYKMGNS